MVHLSVETPRGSFAYKDPEDYPMTQVAIRRSGELLDLEE